MPTHLRVDYAEFSDKGLKKTNQDACGINIPKSPLLSSKGIAMAIADGISTSAVSELASEASVNAFINDYFDTSEAWSVNKSAQQVLVTNNSWLHAKSQRSNQQFNKDKGYVCTFSGLIIKSTTAHVFHIGDSRVYLFRKGKLQQLTEDHRHWVTEDQHYLSRGMGINAHLEIDYTTLTIEHGDIFMLATDGAYEFNDVSFMIENLQKNAKNLQQAAKEISQHALQQGSHDNRTVQLLAINQLPLQTVNETYQALTKLPFPPPLSPRQVLDGYRIVKSLHKSKQSDIYLAIDQETNHKVVLKTPAKGMTEDAAYLERFLMEEWIAHRIDNANVLAPHDHTRKRQYFYITSEYIEGQTLAQWMVDHPNPDLNTVRTIVTQIAKGLMAFHRQEMVHQDIRPENIMIDSNGTIKIIDFSSTKVAGLTEINAAILQQKNETSSQYNAPEYFLGQQGKNNADIYSLAVITYQMLTSRLPFGTKVANATTARAQKKLQYRSVLDDDSTLPAWIDDALWKALTPSPVNRYQELSEFLYDLHYPSDDFLNDIRPPLLTRNPLLFWQGLCALLAMTNIIFILN